jgi:membrane fusion protein, heavy metal efflux system
MNLNQCSHMLALVFLLCWSCKQSSSPEAEGPVSSPAPNERKKEISDLDKPVEELFAATCEHHKKTYECDECRYEVGVVRVPECLLSGGLLKTVILKTQRMEDPLLLTGEVRFDERRVTHLSSTAEGIIRKVFVMLGDSVKVGQALIEIESVSVGEAESAYLEAKATLQLAQRSYDRQSELRKELISSEREYLQAKQKLEAAEIRAMSASAKLTRMGIPLQKAQGLTQENARARVVLRAPAEGMVLQMHAVPGESARMEESLLTIGDSSTLWVWADLYERDLARVLEAQRRGEITARVSARAFPREVFPGVVDFIGPVMDEASRTLKMRIEVKNPGARLMAGMFVNVSVFLPGEESVLALPIGAVLTDDGRSFVFVAHHGEYYVRRPVTTGRGWGDWIEITGGLSGGETVVADGVFLLKSDVLRSKMGAGCAD